MIQFLSFQVIFYKALIYFFLKNLDGESNLKQRESPRGLILGDQTAPTLDVKVGEIFINQYLFKLEFFVNRANPINVDM